MPEWRPRPLAGTMADAHDANAELESSLHMRCAWRELASYVDVWWVPAFIGWCLFLLIVVFALRNRVPRPPWMKYWWERSIIFMDKRRFDQWLRDTGWGWTIIVRLLLMSWFLLLFAWPLISPTFCENVKCRGFKDRLPPTECLPQNASPSPAFAQGACHLHQRHPGAATA